MSGLRALALVAGAALVAMPPGARADRQRVTIGGAPIELAADAALVISPEADGWLVRARDRPAIWLGVEEAACAPSPRRLAMARPTGFFPVSDPPAHGPPQAAAWDVLCFPGDRVALRMLIEVHPYGDTAVDTYVDAILTSIRGALRPPLEVVPKVVLDRARYDLPVTAGDRPGSLAVDGVFLDVSIDAARCPVAPAPSYAPAGTPPPAIDCRELPEQAITVELRDPRPSPAPPVPELALEVRQALLLAAQQAYGTAVIVRGHYRPGWANGELPLDRLPLGAWRLSTTGDVIVLHLIGGSPTIEIAPGACTPSFAGAGRVMVATPRFLPRRARDALVETYDTGWTDTAGSIETAWRATACFPMLDTTATVTIAGLSGAPDDATARAFAAALTDVAGAPRIVTAIEVERGAAGLGLLIDGWLAGRVSYFGQFEVYDSGDTGLSSARLEGGVGPGFSRPGLRAGLHLGFSLEQVAMDDQPGVDRNGGALFVEGRVHLGRRALVEANVRGAWFFDLDCTDTESDDDLFCGPSNHADHHASLGLEAEARLGLGARRLGFLLGGYLGARWFAVRSDDDSVESHGLLTLGFATW